ncbi:hypothetical protein CVT24_006989 [Panaeolus cyanescens]|uniref:DUF6589 domain-containing protein n=1 Tax=Panaeolus cyanescens TaxID=181874 RepID=A0A409X8Y0_9AGAR|nr:hypothetical protein CVT24_006989 [Panaeolus cyanescens]
MLAFRGTGKTPKYADALFGLTVRLKAMHPTLRDAWLKNWLANLTGKPNGFKEMDLLQEHFNFWAKVVYTAKGSNRSWEWLSTISTCIFALRDVVRNMQSEFRTPFNSHFHASPSTATDIKLLQEYLETHKIQSHYPQRQHNDDSVLARDLIQCGADYANRPTAFRNFVYIRQRLDNLGVADADNAGACSDSDLIDEVGNETPENGDIDDADAQSPMSVDFEDLQLDEEEYPFQMDLASYISSIDDMMEEFARLE